MKRLVRCASSVDEFEERFQPTRTSSGYVLDPAVSYALYMKLPKYARDSSTRKVVRLDVHKTPDGNHYSIKYDNDDFYDDYGWTDFVYNIKNDMQS